AEDGIRDFHVTGVQTCALPIYEGLLEVLAGDAQRLDGGCNISMIDFRWPDLFGSPARFLRGGPPTVFPFVNLDLFENPERIDARSEERRVGKECRYRCPGYLDV